LNEAAGRVRKSKVASIGKWEKGRRGDFCKSKFKKRKAKTHKLETLK